MNEGTVLTKADLEDVLCGVTLLGSGGGGPVWMGQSIIESLEDGTVQLVDPETVPDEATMAVISFFGAPELLQGQNLDYGQIAKIAFDSLAKTKGTPFTHVVPLETGAGNSFIPVAVAALNQIPLVDGDGAGRAVPLPTACTWATLPISPIVVARSQEEMLTLDAPNMGLSISDLLGILMNTPDFAQGSGLAMWAMSGQDMKKSAVRSSISKAQQLGQCIRQAIQSGQDPVAAAVAFLGGKKLFVGRVIERNIPESLAMGSIVFSDGNTNVTVFSYPDNMIVWSNEEPTPLAVAPDLIGYMTPAGQPLSISEVLPPGSDQEIAIITASANPALLTPPVSTAYQSLLASMGYAGPLPTSTKRLISMDLYNTFEGLRTSINSESLPWEAAHNHLTQLSHGELRQMLVYTPGADERSFAEREQLSATHLEKQLHKVSGDYPSAVDWRDMNGHNYVTSIKAQSVCSSCVAFGLAAAMETQARIDVGAGESGALPDLSEAQLFFCSGNDHNCLTGWNVTGGFTFAEEVGVVPVTCFPYNFGDILAEKCQSCDDWESQLTTISSHTQLGTPQDMKSWLANRGPLLSTFAVYLDFILYRSGVYVKHNWRGLNIQLGGHCVCIIGYDDAKEAWLCKNGWGTGWGESGFFWMGYGQCGIDATMWGIDGFKSIFR